MFLLSCLLLFIVFATCAVCFCLLYILVSVCFQKEQQIVSRLLRVGVVVIVIVIVVVVVVVAVVHC